MTICVSHRHPSLTRIWSERWRGLKVRKSAVATERKKGFSRDAAQVASAYGTAGLRTDEFSPARRQLDRVKTPREILERAAS